MTGEITKYIRHEKYDSLNGKWLREVAPTDIVVIGSAGALYTATSDNIVATHTTSSNDVLYPYLFVVEACTQNVVFAIVVGGSTQHSMKTDIYNYNQKIEMRPEAPITKVEANSSISIVVSQSDHGQGTIDYQAFLTCKREPIPERLEPNLF